MRTRDIALVSVVMTLMLASPIASQDAENGPRVVGEEIDITLSVQQLGGTLLPSVIVGEDVFLPVTDLFRFLRIQCLVSVTGDTLTGFFLSEDTRYEIDFATGRIRLGEKEHALLKEDVVRTEMAVFLRLGIFRDLFGLDCAFDARALRVDMRKDLRIPIIKEMERERLRRNVQRLNGLRVPDRMLPREGQDLRAGVFDWKLSGISQSRAASTWKAEAGAGFGVLGGDADAAYMAEDIRHPDSGRFSAQWRWIRNSSSLLRQVALLHGSLLSVGSEQRSLTGLFLSNRRTGLRTSFGSYVVDGYTGTEWTVELFLNEVLVDVTTSDANGYYRFEMPLPYGKTTFTLRFFGPWGEERTQERIVDIPFTFLPEGELEYSLHAGYIDGTSGKYAAALRTNFGAGRHLTLGGGTDLIASGSATRLTPALDATVRPGDGFLLSLEYLHRTRFSAAASVTLPGRVSVQATYIHHGQDAANAVNAGSELRSVAVSAPVAGAFAQGNVRMLLRQEISGEAQRLGIETVFSGSVLGIRGNLSLNGDRLTDRSRTLFTSLSVSVPLPMGGMLRPQIAGDLARPGLREIAVSYEQPIADGSWLTASLRHDMLQGALGGQIGIRYELPFAQTSAALSIERGLLSSSQSAGGSVLLDDASVRAIPLPRAALRRGGLRVEAYLDVNANGIRDAGESRVSNLEVKVDGGRMLPSSDDTLVRIVDLEAYRKYFVEVSPVNFENISWQLPFQSLQIEALPNLFVSVSVPVLVAGEASGSVRPDSALSGRRLGGLRIRFVRPDGSLAASVLTERDGSFYYLGLPPGEYTVMFDADQLSRLQFSGSSTRCVVRASAEGDIIEGLSLPLGPAGRF